MATAFDFLDPPNSTPARVSGWLPRIIHEAFAAATPASRPAAMPVGTGSLQTLMNNWVKGFAPTTKPKHLVEPFPAPEKA